MYKYFVIYQKKEIFLFHLTSNRLKKFSFFQYERLLQILTFKKFLKTLACDSKESTIIPRYMLSSYLQI